jgi:hypothetical protein
MDNDKRPAGEKIICFNAVIGGTLQLAEDFVVLRVYFNSDDMGKLTLYEGFDTQKANEVYLTKLIELGCREKPNER